MMHRERKEERKEGRKEGRKDEKKVRGEGDSEVKWGEGV